MKAYWDNDGQADEHGQFAAIIDLEDGAGVQRFTGASEKDVADKLLDAQLNASQKIRQQEKELKATRKPDPAQPARSYARKPLSADDRYRLAQELNNPETAPEAIRTVLESEIGVPADQLRERLAADEQRQAEQAAIDEANSFIAATPDYKVSPHNSRVLAAYLENQGWAWTANNLSIAWESLKGAGLVQTKNPEASDNEPAGGLPAQPESAQQHGGLPAQPAVNTRPRGETSSTGIRTGDSSATQAPPKQPQKYTRAQIEMMGADEYHYKLRNEPGFAQVVEQVLAPKAAAR